MGCAQLARSQALSRSDPVKGDVCDVYKSMNTDICQIDVDELQDHYLELT